MLRRVTASRCVRVGVAVLITLGPVACSESGTPPPGSELKEAAFAGQGTPGDVLEEVRRVQLEEDTQHAIGGIGDLAFDGAGGIYLADTRMRELKGWSADGRFRGVLGSVGRGPGEYLLPNHVAAHDDGRRLSVLDPLGSRLVTYDASTLADLETRQLEAPVSLVKLAIGEGDSLFVAGVDNQYAVDDRPRVVALLTDAASPATELLPLPERFRNRAFGGSYVSGFVDRIDTTLFMGIRGSRVLYRLNLETAEVDSLALPGAYYVEPPLPPMADVEDPANLSMREFMTSRDWTNAVAAIDHEHLLVDVMVYNEDDDLWRHKWAFLTWDDTPSLLSFPACHCFAGSTGQGVAMLEGFYPRPYTVTWYRLPATE